VTSDSPDNTLNSPTINNGNTFIYTFNQLGTYTYHCNFHPNMKGTIIVKPENQVPTV